MARPASGSTLASGLSPGAPATANSAAASIAGTFPSGPRRILIVRLSHLGDVAQTLALYHGVRRRWPEAEIGWAIQPEFAGLIEPLARVFLFDRRGGFRAWPRIRRAMRAWAPDVALDAQGNWKSAACTRLSGARLRFGFERNAWQEPLAARLAGVFHAPTTFEGDPRRSHLVARCRALASFVTGQVAASPTDGLDPQLSPGEREEGRAALLAALQGTLQVAEPSARGTASESGSPLVLLHPGVEIDPRTWPASHFEGLGQALVRRAATVLYITGPGEVEVGRRLATSVPGAAHVVGQRGLRALAALFAAAAERHAVLFVSDSGPAHVAASVGLSVRLLAGPEDPARTGPWPMSDDQAPGPHGPLHEVVAAGGREAWSPRPMEATRVEDALTAALPVRLRTTPLP